MTTPVRLQLSRRKGFRLQEQSLATNGLPAIIVARPSLWGNPWRVSQAGRFHDGAPAWFGRHDWEINYPFLRTKREAAQRAVDCHAKYVDDLKQGRPRALFISIERAKTIRSNPEVFFGPLRGKNLACWCDLDMPCHADTLLALANPKCEEVKA